jgi:hypothetical protein
MPHNRQYELENKLESGEPLTDEEIVELFGEQSGCVRGAFENDKESFERFKTEIVPRAAAGERFDFSGQNCDPDEGECPGWDGVSRRCVCGNRRVEWICDHGSWYGEAY